ncbi:Hypothetical protein IALB_3034 [Ignavibacterium album JCM 16511]|uniref:CRISPR-associated endonuclease Cas9 n=1 Tax=Ignavibacterium album (strain DSM 19864 / JCM 16511 / NBRC 101810 / Mat9-16) TaxID=945713 RepID=I0AP30_IGNAJ|nr:type II CRISPR RNA-guided endonuclease Cas9 [Ignavibacterium album]AFH50737.1 Hypothetical protein IALB_3034 [Ignavibacterium album JCM 16511]
MEFKKVLGLDIGTNSIGCALLSLPKSIQDYGKGGRLEWLTSRVIPLDADYMKAFIDGKNGLPQVITPAGKRRQKRGSRRLKHRYKLRRSRLIRVFKTLNWLPEDFPLDNPKRIKETISTEGKFSFRISDYVPISDESYREFYREFGYPENEIEQVIEEINFRRKTKGKNKNPMIKLLPEDWVVYYLRKKALIKPTTKEELIRIIYLFNQRRGFKSSRKDLTETAILDYDEFAKRLAEKEKYSAENYETKFVSITKVKEVVELKTDGRKGKKRFKVILEDSRIEPYEIERKEKPDWEGKEYTFLVTQKLEKGKFKQNKPDLPKEEDWALCTTALDNRMGSKHPGEFFFDELLKAFKEKRGYKIRQYPVNRWRYKKELEFIWTKQCQLNPELNNLNINKEILRKLATVLYPSQSKFFGPKIKEFENSDVLHIISEDIIYYQRDLKSQKSLISECRYEKRKGIDGEIYGLKCIPKSSPLYQEFRIWQDIHNIKVIRKESEVNGKKKINIDETQLYINENIKEKLFELFNSKDSLSEKDILELISLNIINSGIKISKKEEETTHRINLFANRKELKGNETKSRYRKVFKKLGFDGEYILNHPSKLNRLWHSDYSNDYADKEKTEKSILSSLGWKNRNGKWEKSKNYDVFNLPLEVAKAIANLPPLKKEYGSYSALAIRKMLVVMRDGKYWQHPDQIAKDQENTSLMLFDKNLIQLTNNQRKVLNKYLLTLAEVQKRSTLIKQKLNEIEHNPYKLELVSDQDLEKQVLKSFLEKKNESDYLKGLKTYQAGYLIYGKHSEKDVPIVNSPDELGEYIRKKLPNNSLRNPIVEQVIRETIFIVRDVWKSFGIIDEIHIELGRELKNNSEERKKTSESQEKNFQEKERARKLLKELLNSSNFEHYDENGNKIFSSFTVNPNPDSPLDIEKFRIWKNQSGLTDEELNKKLKDEKIPTEIEVKKYILWLTQKCRSPYTGKIIPLSKLFDSNVYEIEHIIPRSKMKNDSTNNLVICELGVNKAKGDRLAANFISESNGKCKFGEVEYTLLKYGDYLQYCKDTFKYQKAKYKNLLATEPPEDFIERQINDTRYIGRKLAELLTPVVKDSKNIIFTIGSITSELKITWGLNGVWKDILRPRFKRLESIINKKLIFQDEDDPNKYHFDLSINPQLDKEGLKRLDHRHHALDATIIAATTREHVRYLNSLNAADNDEEKREYFLSLCNHKIRDFKLPWENFTSEVKSKLLSCVVSYKESKPILSDPFNKYLKWEYKNGKWQKVFAIQIKNDRWKAVRRSMFKEPIGTVWIKKIKEVSLKEAIKIQAIWEEVKNDPVRKKKEKYIYDDYAQKVIAKIVQELGLSSSMRKQDDEKLNKFINEAKVSAGVNKNLNTTNKTIYNLEGRFYEKIKVAEYVLYKAKRMPLNKKEYIEKLSLQKMFNDLPNFILEKSILDNYPEILKELESDNKYIIEPHKKNNPVNRLLLEHILEYHNNPKEAFSTEGLEKLNKKAINKIGKPIKYITRLDGDINEEEIFRGAVFETDKGSNVYFVMYENNQTKDREFLKPNPSISVLKAIEHKNKIDFFAPNRLGFSRIILSPGDLVYVPTNDQYVLIKDNSSNETIINWDDNEFISNRIYQVKKFTGNSCYFLKNDIASLILSYSASNGVGEFGSQNISEYSVDDPPIRIKDVCIKIRVDRLGNVRPL